MATIDGAARRRRAAPPRPVAGAPKAGPAAKDLTAPKLSAAHVKGQSLRRLRSTGKLKLKLGCDEACTFTATLELKVARAAGARGAATTRTVKLGKVTVRLSAKGARTVTLRALEGRKEGAAQGREQGAPDAAAERSTTAPATTPRRAVAVKLRR